MSTGENILFTKDVMAELRYLGMSAFYAFLKDERHKFPQPFKIGRRNAWHREDVQNWLTSQRHAATNQ
ncbi:helix-turn-helix transcriptional regulator [Klebsiella quasipneumoniae]|uniref:helix-turn-helix transcriptional regulator n=1 Tax=Klebsiella quasipneumoniae TaxID=1463165 RepID=UPI00352B89C2